MYYYHPPPPPPPVITQDMVLTAVIMVVTNLVASIPVFSLTFRHEYYYEALMALSTCISSTLYHVGEAIKRPVFGMSDGKWHRLDNIFIISGIHSLFFRLLSSDLEPRISVVQSKPRRKSRRDQVHGLEPTQDVFVLDYSLVDACDYNNGKILLQESEADRMRVQAFQQRHERQTTFLRFALMCFTIWCQEKAPWNEFYTFLPIAIGIFAAFVRYFFLIPRQFRPRFHWWRVLMGIVSIVASLFFFIRGLDDKRDYLRIQHGLWHVLCGVAVLIFSMSKQRLSTILPADRIRVRIPANALGKPAIGEELAKSVAETLAQASSEQSLATLPVQMCLENPGQRVPFPSVESRDT